MLGQHAEVEKRGAKGRADMIVQAGDAVYIFEFKLDGSADEALKQIEDKDYAGPYAASGKRIVAIGVRFDPKERNIMEWKIKESLTLTAQN
jgi:hypothetical protein